MSEILIKGVEMPKGCDGCFCNAYNPISNEFFCNLTLETMKDSYAEEKPKWCPLKEVLTHGRSIDADKLKDTIVRCINDAEKEYPKEDFGLVKMVYESCLYHIMNAPTVLEANT